MNLSRHAEQRMSERGISREDISAVLDAHDVSFPDKKGNRCYVRRLDGRSIKVVIAADDAEFVITVIDLDA